jgi:hypothetical protein
MIHPSLLSRLAAPASRLALGALLLAMVFALGCSSASSGGPSPTGTTGASATYSAGPFTVEAGSEIVMCTFVQGTNDEPEDVSAFQTLQSAGGHHIIVYTVDHTVDQPPTPCSQGGQPGWNQLLGSQIKVDGYDFPPGVGFQIAAHQQFVMETHYINTTDASMQVESSFTIDYSPVGTVKIIAGGYFFGTLNINIPPSSPWSNTVTCSPPAPMTLYTMAGHEHRWGVGLTVGMNASAGLYKSTTWDLPPAEHFSPGLTVGTTDSLTVTCNWENTGATPLSYPNEMCYALGLYWPAIDDKSMFCASGGGTAACQCGQIDGISTGPGGSSVEVTIDRTAQIPGAVGDIAGGAPIYCVLYRNQDWSGLMPKPGAQPYYLRDVENAPLTNASTMVSLTIDDVTPGDYRVTCFMDSIGGGFYPGKGDPVNASSPVVSPALGQTAKATVTLDYALP